MESTEGQTPEENPHSRNSSENNQGGATPATVVFGPPRPSTVDTSRIGIPPIPLTRRNNEDGSNTATITSTQTSVNPGIRFPGTIPMRMRFNLSRNDNQNDPAAAAQAAFAALQHPHVQAAMARHASRTQAAESTADNATGQPQRTILRHNSPNPQRITVVPAVPTPVPVSSSSMTTSLPPLQSQPLPYSNTIDDMDIKPEKHDTNSKYNNTADMKEFLKTIECRICFEYMESPVGCPNESCDARFCFSCLHRSVSSSTRQGNDNDAQQVSKCPCCRKEFPSDKFIIPDVKLKGEIMNSHLTAVCPFPNCQMRVPLMHMKNHEKTCEYIPVRCKYSSVGCKWTGPKRDLSGHLSLGCHYHKVPGLVEEVRKNRVEHAHILHHLNAQTATVRQMVMEQTQMITMIQMKNINNILDILQLVFTCTCHTFRFLVTGKPIWKPLFHRDTSRATVFNVLCLLPWLLWVTKIFARGIHCIMNFHEYVKSDSPELTLEVIDDVILSFALCFIGVLVVICFHVDEGNSLEWTRFQMPSQLSSYVHPMLRDAVAFASMALVFACVEFDELLGKRIFLWFVCTSASIMFPPIVDEILRAASQPDTNNNTPRKNGRAFGVIIFGAKYGLFASMCDLTSTLDALMLIRMLKTILRIPDNVFILEETECMVSDFGHYLGYIAIAHFAIILARFSQDKEELQMFAIQTCVAMVPQIFVNLIVTKFFTIANKVGSQIAVDSVALSRNSQPKWKYINGAFCFGAWILGLGCILIS